MKWEDMCLRCGLCCHEKVVEEDCLTILDETCAFFDDESGLCKVYKERFSKCPRCLKVTVARAMTAPFLPDSCAYVIWARKHHIRLRRHRVTVFSSEP